MSEEKKVEEVKVEETKAEPITIDNKGISDKAKDFVNNTKDETKSFDKKDIASGKGMAVLSYIFPFIPYFKEKKNKYVMYHAKQGMNLLIIAIAYAVADSVLSALIKVKGDCGLGAWGDLIEAYGGGCEITPWWVRWPLLIIGIGISLLALLGIINACNGKAKELPLVNKVKIIK